MNRLYIFILLVIASLGAQYTFSQDDDIRDKIEDIKLTKMTKKLALEEPAKTEFIDKYKTFSKEMRELNKKRAKVYIEITEKVESGDGMDSLVNQLLDYENSITEKRKDFIADLRSMLTSQQIAKMIIFERKFNNELKKLLKQYQKESRKNFKD